MEPVTIVGFASMPAPNLRNTAHNRHASRGKLIFNPISPTAEMIVASGRARCP